MTALLVLLLLYFLTLKNGYLLQSEFESRRDLDSEEQIKESILHAQQAADFLQKAVLQGEVNKEKQSVGMYHHMLMHIFIYTTIPDYLPPTPLLRQYVYYLLGCTLGVTTIYNYLLFSTRIQSISIDERSSQRRSCTSGTAGCASP